MAKEEGMVVEDELVFEVVTMDDVGRRASSDTM
jgi:hypothetical protein